MKGGTKTTKASKSVKPKNKVGQGGTGAKPGSKDPGAGTVVVRAPAASAYSTQTPFKVERSTRYKDGVCITGEDHLEFVTIAASYGTGAVLNEVYINPSEIGGTRLEKWAQMYEKYIFTDLVFEYLPACGSDSKGSIILAYDRDISDPTPPATEQGLRQFTAYEGSKDGNVWERIVIKAKIQAPDSGYYTNAVVNGDDRLSYQGQLYVAVVVPSAGDFTCGRLRIKYRIELFVPQLEQGVLTSELVGSQINVGFPAGSYDFLKMILDSLVINEGVGQWLPKLDSSGKAFIRLAQGVYRLTQYLRPLLATATSSFTNSFDPPSLVTIEEVETLNAPQPWVEVLTHADDNAFATEQLGNLAQETLLGVPRGGADMYTDVELLSGATNPGADGFIYDQFLERISGYTQSSTSFFLARWQGKECRKPLASVEKALERGMNAKKRRPLIALERYAAVIKQSAQRRVNRAPPSPAYPTVRQGL